MQMKESKILYTENSSIAVKYCHPKSNDYLTYDSIITIKEAGKFPVEMKIKFDGIPPFLAPMPPEEHEFKADSIVTLHLKYAKWFTKYGYIIV